MPIYSYLCPLGHRTERMRAIKDRDGIATCPQCLSLMQRVPDAPGFVLKGAGFYRTEYAPPQPAED